MGLPRGRPVLETTATSQLSLHRGFCPNELRKLLFCHLQVGVGTFAFALFDRHNLLVEMHETIPDSGVLSLSLRDVRLERRAVIMNPVEERMPDKLGVKRS